MTELNFANLDRIIKATLLDDRTDNDILMDIAHKGLEQLDELKAHADVLGIVIAETAMQHLAFNKERLEAHRAEVTEMFSQLSDDFKVSGGGGMSLIQMPFTKDGTQWGEQWHADMLLGLGVALGVAHFTIPDRAMWDRLPGGLPYITVTV